MSRLSSLLAVALVLVLGSSPVPAEVINFQTCPDSVDTCTIQEVRVNPCPEALNNAACNIRRRRTSQMSFDFTPQFDADTLVASLGWAKSETVELPLLTMDRDTCKYTTCPVRSGVKQTYTIDVPIESKFPLSPYTIRWAFKDPVSGKRCCFTHDIKVVR
ncbi:MD-2-related lipid-recognition protein-like [Drosophila ficusphila]|uniref:MD-2-related lipid-recognition protein-like n=1 Tax=Drosophila ficusphila TaxID=30025 RepID=UPI0007E7E160|nr:MD-2-related lipid-recognition protein-like [Drosophila ficusphila]